MSIYNKPDLKINIGCNTPSYHKKINSMSISSSTNTGRNQQGNVKKYNSKNKYDTKITTDISSDTNIINQIIPNSNINKILTSANCKNRRIEININKNNSPNSFKFNKSVCDNANNVFYKHKHTTSQNNIINNKIINYNINNDTKDINHTKSKNSLNNINININISKKIISTYYNKSKDKKNLIVKKKSINSLNNSNKKKIKNNKCYQKKNSTNFNNKGQIKSSNNEIIEKNQSERIVTKSHNDSSYLINYYSNQNKNNVNNNSLAYCSTNSNMSTTTNKNNNNNINNSNIYYNNNNNQNHTQNEIYNNYFNSDKDIKKKNNLNIVNKIIKENKSGYFSQLQSPISQSHIQGNINSIQNYLKYLNVGQKNKNYKNNPPITKSKIHKLSENNINYLRTNTESNIYNNNIFYNSTNYETHANFTQNFYNKSSDDNSNITKTYLKRNKKYNISSISDIKDTNNCPIETPEELHFFYIRLLQKGKKLNFDFNN